MNAYFYHTKLGRMFIAEDGQAITQISLIPEPGRTMSDTASEQAYQDRLTKGYEISETRLLREAAGQLSEYLDGKRKEFNLSLNPKGTKFQRQVWDALQRIPYGETRSYKEIAEAVGNSKACRAVGMANHNNPIICIIPCHRVIGANGSLVGYGGGLDKKEWLLKLEEQFA